MERVALHGMSWHDGERLAGHGAGRAARSENETEIILLKILSKYLYNNIWIGFN